jgi:hypothetical protein
MKTKVLLTALLIVVTINVSGAAAFTEYEQPPVY